MAEEEVEKKSSFEEEENHTKQFTEFNKFLVNSLRMPHDVLHKSHNSDKNIRKKRGEIAEKRVFCGGV